MKTEKGNKGSPPRESLKVISFFAVCFLLSVTGNYFKLPFFSYPIIWLPAGLLFSVALVSSKKLKCLYVGAGIFAFLIADRLNSVDITDSVVNNLGLGVATVLACALINKVYKKEPEIGGMKDFSYIVILPSFVLPLTTSFIAGNIHLNERTITYMQGWEGMWFSSAIGYLIFIPLFVIHKKSGFSFFSSGRKTEIISAILLFLTLGVTTFLSLRRDMELSFYEEFFIFFIVIIISYRYGIRGASLAMLVIAVTSAAGFKNYLPGTEAEKYNIIIRIISFKSLFVSVSVCIQLFSIVIKQNKTSEIELKSSNSLLNATLDSTENGILTVDLTGNVIILNKKFLDLWNIPGDFEGKKNDGKLTNFILKQLKNPEEFLELIEYLRAHPAKESLDFVELSDGRILERYSKPQKLEERIVGRVWSFRDITEQRIAEAEIIKARDAYLRVLDESPALIWRADKTAKCDWFNRAWLEFTGRSIEQEIGDGWIEGVHKDDLKECIDHYVKNFNRRQQFKMEYRLRNAAGEYRWILDTGKPNYVGKDDFQGYIGYCFDITERKTAEAKIIESEKITSELIANVPEIIVVHYDGFVQFLNKTGEKALGYTLEEVFGKSLSEFFDEEQYKIIEDKMRRRAKGEKLGDYEIAVNTRQGIKRNVIVRAVNINYYGRPAVLAMLIDISEIKAYETELEELNATKNKLLSIISHDLKGPFQGFLGVSDLLANEIESLNVSEIKTMALELNHSLQKQYHLLNEVLSWTKMQNNGFKYEPAKLNLRKEIASTINSLESSAIRKEICLVSEINKEQEVFADPNMLQIVLRNLISNAVKFSYRGTEVKISAYNSASGVEICVADRGVGIDNDDMERLFDIKRRFSYDGTESEQGTGLGLIFCKEIMEKHEGYIKCKSEPGNGSVFCIFFPFGK
jgi:PAS domain S-box-containing protein